MLDIWLGTFVLILLTAACFFLGLRLTRYMPVRQSGVFAVLVVVLMTVCLLLLQDSLLLAYLFPQPGVVVLGSTALPLIALLAGTLTGRHTGKKRRSILIPGLLIFLGALHASRPFWGAVPPIAPPHIRDEVVLQTAESSCSAASAATMLNHYGIPATEQEMANLSFTRRDGTAMLGVYRGLHDKTENTPWSVSVLAAGTVEDLRRLTQEGPILLSVGLDRFSFKKIDPRYQEAWGWTPGKRHAVVLFGFLPGGYLDIGDPATGRERWREESLAVLWHGDGIRLKHR